jgi:hypothetical protein
MKGTHRRRFLGQGLSAGALSCLGCSGALARAEESPDKHRFLADSGMSFKEVFEFAFKNGFIPTVQGLAEELGHQKLVEMLKKAASKAAAEGVRRQAGQLPANDLAAFTAPLRGASRFWNHVLSLEIVEDTERAVEVRITECLWAAVFREAKAPAIGYACICHPDFAMAQAFNPKMKLARSKTLMQGHDCCNHRWVVEA